MSDSIREPDFLYRANETECKMHGRAKDLAPYGIPLVNYPEPAWTVHEFRTIVMGRGFKVPAVWTLNPRIIAGEVDGAVVDRDGRPIIPDANVDRVLEALGAAVPA